MYWKGEVVEEETLENCNLEDVRDNLPDHQPRYLVQDVREKLCIFQSIATHP